MNVKWKWSDQNIAEALAKVPSVKCAMRNSTVLFIVMDFQVDGYSPDGGSEYSVVEGQVSLRFNDLMAAMAPLFYRGFPLQIRIVPTNFTMPVPITNIFYRRTLPTKEPPRDTR